MPSLEPLLVPSPLHAFTGYGIELEYMIVDAASLKVQALADRLLIDSQGQVVNELERGELAWSNELVAHVIELKTNGPADSLSPLGARFHGDVVDINSRLAEFSASLMPTAMHPMFKPALETRLWQYGQNEIYAAYDRIFDCRGHGWSNLQSMHINLPFYDDDEFRRLHAAIRVALPLIPALSAASPLEEGRRSAWLNGRLAYYRNNQRAIPEISGPVIPEAVTGIDDYHARILAPMYQAIGPHDPDNILADDWLNSRAAIARFERQTLEIRIIDLQECPAMDLAIAEAVVALVQALYEERLGSFDAQQAIVTDALADQLWAAAADGGQAVLAAPGLAALLGLPEGLKLSEAWSSLLAGPLQTSPDAATCLELILSQGSLAERIVRTLGDAPDQPAIERVYRDLIECLASNRAYRP